MIEDFMERAWSCLAKFTEKKPPDRSRRSSNGNVSFSTSGLSTSSASADSGFSTPSYLTLDPATLPAQQELDEAFQKLLVRVEFLCKKEFFRKSWICVRTSEKL